MTAAAIRTCFMVPLIPSLPRPTHKSTFHKISPKHLDRYVREFAGRHNLRDLETIDQMAALVRCMVGKRLTYRDLIA